MIKCIDICTKYLKKKCCFQKDVTEPMAGYLSLHQTANSLIIKWTPNQLMNCHSPGTNQNDHPEIDASDKRLVFSVGNFIYNII